MRSFLRYILTLSGIGLFSLIATGFAARLHVLLEHGEVCFGEHEHGGIPHHHDEHAPTDSDHPTSSGDCGTCHQLTVASRSLHNEHTLLGLVFLPTGTAVASSDFLAPLCVTPGSIGPRAPPSV